MRKLGSLSPTESLIYTHQFVIDGRYLYPVALNSKYVRLEIDELDLLLAQYISRLESAPSRIVWEDTPSENDQTINQRQSGQIVPLSTSEILKILGSLNKIRAQLIGVLLQCASLSSSIKSIFLAEEQFFEYNGTGRPPTSEKVLSMDLVPAF